MVEASQVDMAHRDRSKEPEAVQLDPVLSRWAASIEELNDADGHFTLDIPALRRILDKVPHVAPPERDDFSHGRYTALDCHPDDFVPKKFILRPSLFIRRPFLFKTQRRTEILMVIPICRLDSRSPGKEAVALARTLASVIDCVHYSTARKNTLRDWTTHLDEDSWKQIVVALISEGPITHSMRVMLEELGACLSWGGGVNKVFRSADGTIRTDFPSVVNGVPVRAHLFEVVKPTLIHDSANVRSSTPFGLHL